MGTKGKDYHIYIKDESLIVVFDMLNQQRGKLAQVITELAHNGMANVLQKTIQDQDTYLRDIKKVNRILKKTKTIRRNRLDEIYQMYVRRLDGSEYQLTRKENLIWINKYADELGMDDKILLSDFEKKHLKEGKKGD